MSYATEYQASIDSPAIFWGDKAKQLPWFKAPEKILSTDKNCIQRWFADGEMNTCYMALDHHVAQGRGEQVALIYDSPVTATKKQFSYRELLEKVSRFAGLLQANGVGKGDIVVIYMPMISEAVIAMLAAARIGAVHSVVFGGFSAHELAVRIDDAQPKLLITASCGVEVNRIIEYKPMIDEAIELAAYKPARVILLQRQQCIANMQHGRDIDWADAEGSAPLADCVSVSGTDPLYILYTSGTTGKPKGVVRDNGGHAVALKYSMSAVYNMQPGDVFWAASDIGWVVGHSYIVYAPLLHGCTTIVYEGKPVKTPDASAFWRVIEEYAVKAIFAAPTAFRAIRKEDPDAKLLAKYDLSCLESVFMAGERLDPPTYEWTKKITGKPVIDHWWQTETGWAIAANLIGIERLPTKPGSATKPVPGFNVQILDANGLPLPTNSQGAIAIKLPLPPSCLSTIWGDFGRFDSGYLSEYPGYYCSGDGGYIDEDGYLFVMGRTDDVINVAGHRLSTGEMEEVIAAHDAVAECTVIGVYDNIKGQVPVGLTLLKDGVNISEADLQAELVAMVRKEIGAVACLKQTLIVERLPKTRSGKILRKLLRQIAENQEFVIPSTIDDPASIDEIRAIMQNNGLVKPTAQA
ncbi:propionyl-CoA synthetase [Paraglaciecola psychrophila]|uniref:Propionyl-CoA synthetase n=1 Tax=Paraglaciecola psychrophila 170 TaxID=1129794 RepID=K7A769_9ALTE|nr:propionyl-CoA synthetase [Paraglaciecola psychrophila]AGH45509.1 propionyl-CoA synthetase [Paraglaciecola psychrophila 170]GAC38172.1 propionyl-CoA synthetase [Paraglaciecola psychrophila 170]